MKKYIFKCLCLSALVAIAICGCTEDSDTEKPVINMIEPAEGDILKIGSDNGVHFEVEFTDNESLKSYRVNIHDNFDNHTHSILRAETVDFEYENSWEISGKNALVHHHEIKIPEDATPGNYHLTVYCSDAEGNESHVVINVVLSHDADDDDHDEDSDHDHCL
ncbi:MAG: DUF4625 domain-containing protein [Dysgonamonadaceae bacterium]|jgi:hypothetical protein|nr:DUF4625 domain-containing protein [Dysgonamonadaceae bacterium]